MAEVDLPLTKLRIIKTIVLHLAAVELVVDIFLLLLTLLKVVKLYLPRGRADSLVLWARTPMAAMVVRAAVVT